MSIKKILSLFLVGVVQPKLNLYLRGNQTINMEDSYLGMLHDDPFTQYNYYGSQVYVNVPAASPGPSSAQFVHPYVHPSQPSTSTSASCNQIESSQAAGVNFHVINTCG